MAKGRNRPARHQAPRQKPGQPRAARARQAHPTLRNARVLLVASRFNEAITAALVAGALKTLTRHGVARRHVNTVWVAGAFELPVAAASLAVTQRPDAIIALGCVLKGETPQYAAIGQAVAQGLMQVAVTTRIPVTFGVIVADTVAQANARAGGRMGNRGSEAALAALQVVELLGQRSRRFSLQ